MKLLKRQKLEKPKEEWLRVEARVGLIFYEFTLLWWIYFTIAVVNRLVVDHPCGWILYLR